MKLSKDFIIQFAQNSKSFVVQKRKTIIISIASFVAGAASFMAFGAYLSITDPVKEYVDIALLNEAKAEVTTLESDLSSSQQSIKELQAENDELQAKVDEAAPWFKMTDEEKKKTEAEAKAAEEKRLAEEKAKKEAEEKAKKEAEEKAKAEAEAKEKQGYNTGITYSQLARTPDKYLLEKVKFRGKVIQVMEGDGTTTIRLAVNDNYDTVIYGEYDSSVVDSRILEDDWITIYGTSAGLITYQSTMGGQISIPGILIDKIDQ